MAFGLSDPTGAQRHITWVSGQLTGHPASKGCDYLEDGVPCHTCLFKGSFWEGGDIMLVYTLSLEVHSLATLKYIKEYRLGSSVVRHHSCLLPLVADPRTGQRIGELRRGT